MKSIAFILTAFLLIFSLSCNETTQTNELSFFDRVREVPDSIRINDIVIYNLFKYQILAHDNGSFDSTMIIEKVYHAQPKIWNELYGVLFDSAMFATHGGMIKWNGEMFANKGDSIKSRVTKLLNAKFDSTLQVSLEGIKRLTGRTPDNIRLSIILSPVEGIGFGGIENDAFILDLLDNNFDVLRMVQEGIPHELNHFIYESTRANDPDSDTPLRLTIDEGFACYYAYQYFDGKISKAQAVEDMTADEWNWYLLHEKEIFDKCAPYFYYKGKEDPLRKLGPELNAPKTLFYWLGFRIVESYVEKHGADSWKDIYELPVREVLDRSGYKEHIEALQ